MFNFLELGKACAEGSSLLFGFQIARWVIRIIQIAVPFVLIIFGSLDFFKAIVAGDEKEMKQKRKPFVQRVIAALVIILLPTLVNLIMLNIAKNTNNEFADCWSQADPSGSVDIPEDSTNEEWKTSYVSEPHNTPVGGLEKNSSN